MNLAHIQMLTDPFTPMGCSLFRAVTHLSEKYLLYLNGFVFINIAGFTNNWLLRRITISAASRAGSCIERFGTTVDAEMAQIVKEVHKNHYPFFDHTQAAQAFRGIKQEFVKPLVKRVLGYARRRACVAEMEEALARLEKEVEEAAEKKEAAEAALAAMLDRFKEEINGLKAKKKEIEVGVREGGDAQTTLAPLQERFSMQDASLQEKRTELEILGKKRANCEKVCAELATLLANQTRLVCMGGGREA